MILEPMKLERDVVQAELIADLNKAELASIKTSDGDTYVKAVRKAVNITNDIFAYKFALEHRAVKIDTLAVARIVKDMKEVPTGFEVVDSEYISVRKAKKDQNVSE